jgi:hypothetical protein
MSLDHFQFPGGRMFNKLCRFVIMLSICFLGIQTWAGAPHQDVPMTYSGEIMDSLCAKDGSHDKMMDQMKSMGRDKQSCTQKCVQLGAKYALYDPEKKMVYELDDQDKAAEFAGHTVQIKGTLEKKKIKISSIEPTD